MPDDGSFDAGHDLGWQAARSGAVQVGSQVIMLGMFVASGMVLARLLTPADFGIMAMAGTLTALVSTVRGFGFSMAAIQADTVDEVRLQQLFDRSRWYAWRLAVGMLVAAPVLAFLYREPMLLVILALLTGTAVMASLSDLPEALVMRSMRFVALRRLEVASTALGMAAGLIAAWLGAGYWALVLQSASTSVARAFGAWRMVSWRPVLRRSSDSPVNSGTRDAMRFARQYVATNLVTYAAQNLDRVTIGVAAGPHAMGMYDNAYRWGLYPVHQLYPPLLNIAVAGLSRTRDDAELYRRYWSTAMLLVLSVMLPAVAFLGVESEAFILSLLGPAWVEAIPVFRLVMVGAMAIALTRHSRWIFLSEGRTREQLRLSVMHLASMAVAVAVGVRWGVLGVAAGFAASRWLMLGPELAMAFAGSRIRWRDFLTVAWRPLAAAAGATTILVAGSAQLPDGPFLRLVVAATAFGLIYTAMWIALPGGSHAARQLAALARRVRQAPA